MSDELRNIDAKELSGKLPEYASEDAVEAAKGYLSIKQQVDDRQQATGKKSIPASDMKALVYAHKAVQALLTGIDGGDKVKASFADEVIEAVAIEAGISLTSKSR